MQVTSSTSPTYTASTTDDGVPILPSATKKILGQNDFLKLLAVQFQAQDPMKPMEDTSFIASMAQFTALDQSSSLVQQMTQLRANQDISTANSYIGRSVTLVNGDEGQITGEVTAVDLSSGSARLVVGDQTYPISAVLRVERGVAASPSSQPSNSTSV